MPAFELEKYRCPKCGKTYEDSVRAHFPNKPCRECTQLIRRLNQIERQLIAEEFSIEKKDEEIARQINEALSKEDTEISENNEKLLTALIEKLLDDDKRRKKIIKQILDLQKKKR